MSNKEFPANVKVGDVIHWMESSDRIWDETGYRFSDIFKRSSAKVVRLTNTQIILEDGERIKKDSARWVNKRLRRGWLCSEPIRPELTEEQHDRLQRLVIGLREVKFMGSPIEMLNAIAAMLGDNFPTKRLKMDVDIKSYEDFILAKAAEIQHRRYIEKVQP